MADLYALYRDGGLRTPDLAWTEGEREDVRAIEDESRTEAPPRAREADGAGMGAMLVVEGGDAIAARPAVAAGVAAPDVAKVG